MQHPTGNNNEGRGERTCATMGASAAAGLQFPVGRIGRYLREGKCAPRMAASAPVCLAAVLEHLCAEILELAGNAARDDKKSQIGGRHIVDAVKKDDLLNKCLGPAVTAAWAEGGTWIPVVL